MRLSRNVWIGILKPLQQTINTAIGRVLISSYLQGDISVRYTYQIGNIGFGFVFVKVYETSKKCARRLGEFG